MKKLLSLMSVSILLTGCVDWVEGTDDLKVFVEKAKASAPGRIEPLPESKPYESFVYEGASMREPFRPLLPVTPEAIAGADGNGAVDNGIKPNKERIKDYLETFSVDDLEMVGIIFKRGKPSSWALIRDPNAEVHRVTVGDRLGLDFGEVVALDERKIQLKEIISNGRGGWMYRSRTLALEEQE
ncbi:pilus assembly protein PilP [Pontibacter sp. JAM-7]|uniref:pilus assembly protein PilP n=1 Tax=Pontibacter sp. JAM-7 TaxID=3366581 RepID=UPI003AF9B223